MSLRSRHFYEDFQKNMTKLIIQEVESQKNLANFDSDICIHAVWLKIR